ncbi:hypothetical protein PG993_001141 [Apiospora rasikravindrae]|uniref:Uncharacterized protein n=1 Tax=Apiospora rasikravindrae TaxID=990691 RepID=A0ABR1UAK1_9PEZI
MGFTDEQVNDAQKLNASFTRARPPRGKGGKNKKGHASYPASYNAPNGGFNNAPSHGLNSGSNRHRSTPRSHTAHDDGSWGSSTSARRSGSMVSSSTSHQRVGTSFPSGNNIPQSIHGPSYSSYRGPSTPRALQSVPTASWNNVTDHGPNVQHGSNNYNGAVANAARTGHNAVSGYTHQPLPPSSPSEAESRPKGHGGLASSRYADTSKDFSTAPSPSQSNGNAHVRVATDANSLASPGLQSSNASQAAAEPGSHHTSMPPLTTANVFGVGPLSNVGAKSNALSHIRGTSNTSDVEMFDPDGQIGEGPKPLGRHGGIGESRWASSEPNPAASGPSTPPATENRLYWRTGGTWSLAKYKNPTSTHELAEVIGDTSQPRSREQSSQPDLRQLANGTTKHGGLGSSRYAGATKYHTLEC